MLKAITPTESVIANQVAARLVNEILNTAKRAVAIRTEGIPAIAAVPATLEQTRPNGRTIPARPERPAVTGVSPAAIDAALGVYNCELLDEIKALLLA